MPIDKIKNQRKGFCFVTFDNEQIVQELLKTPKQTICGKEVDVKKAQPSQNKGGMMNWGGPMGMGMRGGGRGGLGTSRGGRGGGRGGGRSDWGSWGTGGYNTAYGNYAPTDAYSTGYDYYAGYGGGAYGGYGDGYGGYGSYDAYGYDYDATSSSRGSSRGRGGLV